MVVPPLLLPLLLDLASPLARNSSLVLAQTTLSARADAVDSTLASALVQLLPWSVTVDVALVTRKFLLFLLQVWQKLTLTRI